MARIAFLLAVIFSYASVARAATLVDRFSEEDRAAQDGSREWYEAESTPIDCSLKQVRGTELFAVILDGKTYTEATSFSEALKILRQLLDIRACRMVGAVDSLSGSKHVGWFLERKPSVLFCTEERESGSGIFVIRLNGKSIARFLYRDDAQKARQLLNDLEICQ